MRPFLIAALLALWAAGRGNACSVAMYDPNDLITNPPQYSRNGRYCVIDRWFEGVEDYKAVRAGTALGLDMPEPPAGPDRKTITYAVYESATRKRMTEFSLPIGDDGTTVISDSGHYVAVVRSLRHACSRRAEAEDTLVTIVRSDGTTVGRLAVGDVLTANDILNEPDSEPPFLRHESDTREVLVLTIAGHERRIELESARLLDPKVDLLPSPIVLTDAAPRTRDFGPEPFDEVSAVHLDPRDLLARLTVSPPPQFSEVATKARVEGTVWVQIIVSETGEVVALRGTPFPFGLGEAATTAVRLWRFRPLSVDGHRVKFTGEVAIHFTRRVAS